MNHRDSSEMMHKSIIFLSQQKVFSAIIITKKNAKKWIVNKNATKRINFFCNEHFATKLKRNLGSLSFFSLFWMNNGGKIQLVGFSVTPKWPALLVYILKNAHTRKPPLIFRWNTFIKNYTLTKFQLEMIFLSSFV